jgi:mannose/fructose/N-acetylgalactosamine-specific phosphotransferase system component IID
MSAQQPGGQPQGGVPQRTGGSGNYQEYAKFGLVLYLALALGTFITNALIQFLGDDQNATFFNSQGGEELYFAAQSMMNSLMAFALILALVVAVYYYLHNPSDPAHIASAVAAAAGSIVAFIIGLLLVMIFEPSQITSGVDIGAEIIGMIAAVIGIAATAALTAFGLDNYEQY